MKNIRFLAVCAATAMPFVALANGDTAALTTLSVATQSAPSVNWSGFYAGASAGFGSGNTDHADAIDQSNVGPSTDPEGGLISIYLGYNYQFVNNMVLGVEIDYSASDMNGSASSSPAYGCAAACITEIESFATARVRLGYSIDQWLPYLTAGIASTKYTGTIGALSGSSTETSTTYGVGVDYDLNGTGWVARGEVLRVTDPGGLVFTPTSCVAPGCALRDNEYTVLRFGISRRF